MLTEPRRPILIVSPSALLAGRLADQDHVGRDAALLEPVDDRDRAVGGGAFLVAGDEQRQRAAVGRRRRWRRRRRRRSRSSCHWRRGRSAGRPSMRGSNGSSSQPSPGGTTSRWPAKPKCGAPDPRSATRFSTGPSGASPRVKRWTSNPSGSERGLEHVEHRAGGGGDAGAGDEPAGEVDGVDHAALTVLSSLKSPGERPFCREPDGETGKKRRRWRSG